MLFRHKNQNSESYVKRSNLQATKTQLYSTRRRDMIQNVASILPLQYLIISSAIAGGGGAENVNAAESSSSNLPNGLLEARVLENVLSPPPYGMESNDILYPKYVQVQVDGFVDSMIRFIHE